PAEKTTVPKHEPVAVQPDRQRLADWARGIFECDVLRGEIVGIDLRRRRAERADRFIVEPDEIRVQIETDYRRLRVFADQMEETLLALDVNEFLVSPRLDVDEYVIGRAPRGHGHDGFLHGLEPGAAVLGDEKIRVCRSVETRSDRQQ